MKRFLSRCRRCGYAEWYTALRPRFSCPGCGSGSYYWWALSVRRRPQEEDDMECSDARCRLSEALKCRCSCGGAFHGEDASFGGVPSA